MQQLKRAVLPPTAKQTASDGFLAGQARSGSVVKLMTCRAFKTMARGMAAQTGGGATLPFACAGVAR